MPPPTRVLTRPTTFPVPGLHKSKHHMDRCTLVGTGIQLGDPITVTGTHGTVTTTQWAGYVMVDNGGGSFDSSDLHVVREQRDRTPGPTRGPEDVHVTVTNQDIPADVSAPMPTPAVPTVP